MLLNRIACRKPIGSVIYRTGIRMASTTTIVGQSGRTYVQGDVLQRRQDPRLSIFKAQYVLSF